jgi:hypothetical protein
MFRNFLFHNLKGIHGNSFLGLNRIDVSRVTEMQCRKRVFTFFEKEYPFVLTIEYAKDTTTKVQPFVEEGVHLYTTNYDEETDTITKRYKTEKEVEKEMLEIIKKKNQLIKFEKELLFFFKKNKNKF